MAKRSRRQQPQDAWAGVAEETPQDDLPLSERKVSERPRRGSITTKGSAKTRFYRLLNWAVLISFPLTTLLLIGGFNQIAGLRDQVNGIPTVQPMDSPGKTAAIVEVNRWLGESPQPLLGGQVVSWDGFDQVEKPKQTEQEAKQNPLPDYAFELHRFTLMDHAGALYRAVVQIAVGPGDAGAVVVASPSLEAEAPAVDFNVQSPWYGMGRNGAPKPVEQSVSAWAQAFTSGDPSKLLLAVGDSDASHSYAPLNGVQSVSAHISDAAWIPPEGDEKYQPGSATNLMIAQVELTLDWKGAPALAQNERNQTKVVYDVLVTRADTASPQVVAWGGSGTGPSLKPYENALVGNQVQPESTLRPDGTQSPTPTP